MGIRVLMTPHLDDFEHQESGIRRVVENYFRYLPDYGIELVKPNQSYDIRAVHAGMTGKDAEVAHLHGIYFTADYPASNWEYNANIKIVEALRNAKEVTVPSSWVAEIIQRDMRFSPHVVPHGIDVNEWKLCEHQNYVLWNKNRRMDVCDPTPMMKLAESRPNVQFVTTYIPYQHRQVLKNVRKILPKAKSADDGAVEHSLMRKYISHAMVYLSTTKETFGIGILEAMAAGIPVLGFAWGGNVELIQHGVNGYLAQPNDIEDLAVGLDYCVRNRDVLGANGRKLAEKWDWPSAVEKVAGVYRLAMRKHPHEGEVSVVIPCYNYAHTLERAVNSVLNQTYPASEIIIVDDGSTDDTPKVAQKIAENDSKIIYIRKENGGVGTARNRGIEESRGEYISCLDADDEIAPKFLEACIPELRKDRSLGIAYTGLFYKRTDGSEGLSKWPEDCNYDAHLSYRSENDPRGKNQIPTCCVFRREAWERTGGYKQRYAPLGAGAEDAEFWARIMSIGYGAKKVTTAGLFIYYEGGIISKPYNDGSIDRNLLEPAWLGMHPWARDHKHPFASRATPTRNEDGKPLVSHPVRQYDQPVISIIIPVGSGHEEIVKNALDSCESQTYRRWEAIVVFDNGMTKEEVTPLLSAYPYVRIGFTPPSRKGAGKARNVGVELSRAPFVVFLDADDMLSPDFLDKTLSAWHEAKVKDDDSSSRIIVYSDYVQNTITTQEDLHKNFEQQDILHFIERTGEAVIVGKSAEYDCERAQRQPEYIQKTDPFHWCLVTCLVPKVWHERIGGFDENMESFEDVLYHWKMARYGMCYVHIPEALVMYRMYTGTRRERASIYTDEGRDVARNMLEYAKSELEKIPMSGCKKCPGGNKPISAVVQTQRVSSPAREKEEQRIKDEDYVLCEYMKPNLGNHHIYGHGTSPKEYYGYKGGGSVFLVHKKDIAAQPQLFRPIHQSAVGVPIPEVRIPDAPAPIVQPEPEPVELSSDGKIPEYIAPKVAGGDSDVEEVQEIESTPSILPPVPIGEEVEEKSEEEEIQPSLFAGQNTDSFNAFGQTEAMFDLNLVPGVTPEIAEQLRKKGKDSRYDILDMGIDGLMKLEGVGEMKAQMIVEWLKQNK